MTKYILVSNNNLVFEKFNNGKLGEQFNICLIKCNKLQEAMNKSRDLIHQGYKLLTHPLAGSVKPAQNPYRSIILGEKGELDYESLDIMENALMKLRQFKKNKVNKKLPDSILKDYQVIDYSLLKSGLKSL
ncbi:MAG: GrdX family protein [Halanaerobiales bacterium]